MKLTVKLSKQIGGKFVPTDADPEGVKGIVTPFLWEHLSYSRVKLIEKK